MTIEADLFTTLNGLVGGRMFPDDAPNGTTLPYITYTQMGGDVVRYTEAAVPNVKNGLFQFNVWGATRAACSALILQIEAALVTSALFQTDPQGAYESLRDHDMDLRGARQTFSIWSAR